jgi:carbon storage regulator
MLVLTRKLKESVMVGRSDQFDHLLKVTVLDIQHGKVRLGFEAKADIPVHRLEVWDRICANPVPGNPATDPGGNGWLTRRLRKVRTTCLHHIVR